MESRNIILGEWYIFKFGDKIFCGYSSKKELVMVTFKVRTSSGSWQTLATTYQNVIKKADINAEARSDYIDFLLDIKDFEELKKLFPNP